MFSHQHKYLPHYTHEDYEQWEGNWELIGGIPYSMIPEQGMGHVMEPAPGWYHQKLNVRIVSLIETALIDCSDCEANMPVNWKIAPDTIVQPDVVVVARPFEEGLYLTKTPEMIFEILSPSTAEKDRSLKFELYKSTCVNYYVIVHPLEKSAEVFALQNKEYKSEGTFVSGIYHFEMTSCSFDFDFGAIW